MAVVAILLEKNIKMETGVQELSLSPEVLVPRLGDYLVERGLLEPEELEKALAYQKQIRDEGGTKLIGQTLLELDLISREALDQGVTEQILELQSALQRANDELEERVRERTAQLEQALTRLSELNQLKNNFISNISHELRTPLTHLRGYLELMGENALGDLTPEMTDAVRVMKKSESRLGDLIENLIQFSTYSRGNIDIDIKPVYLKDILEEVVASAQISCNDKGLNCQADFPDELPQVLADSQKLPWVLSHMVDNAVKFTPKGGKVQIGAIVENGLVKLYVFDTGIGIPAEKLDEIFEPFHQLDGSSTRKYGGTGLGLAMARQIVEAHGSEIVVRSKEGNGSYFEFALPVADLA
jgi:signal transduction histidine kinase